MMEYEMSEVEIKPDGFLRLSPGVSIKYLELPYIYDILTDDLYEINEEAIEFLLNCDGSKRAKDMRFDHNFVAYCVREGLIEVLDIPDPLMIDAFRSPIPSLRYLEIQITYRCNRSCRHCYLGDARNIDMKADMVLEAMAQFEKMGGLRVIISGGEPLLHPEWELINDELSGFELRRVLLTNGELITPKIAKDLKVEEVQISIDGMEKGHDAIRGKGSWKKALTGASHIANAGRADLSIATMVHGKNLDEFNDMKELFEELSIREWNIDLPVASGRLKNNRLLMPSIEEAAERMHNTFGASYHGGGESYACGLHLATLTPEGKLLKCGFYPDEPLGTLDETLEKAWGRSKPIKLSELECGECKHLSDCAGGCRFRAGTSTAPDKVMCEFWKKS